MTSSVKSNSTRNAWPKKTQLEKLQICLDEWKRRCRASEHILQKCEEQLLSSEEATTVLNNQIKELKELLEVTGSQLDYKIVELTKVENIFSKSKLKFNNDIESLKFNLLFRVKEHQELMQSSK